MSVTRGQGLTHVSSELAISRRCLEAHKHGSIIQETVRMMRVSSDL